VILNGLNGLLGPETVVEVSDQFKLWVTPPHFIFSIWGIIYTLVTLVLYSACSRNSWSTRSHVWFWVVNILNTLWITVWCRGTKEAMIPAFIIILVLALSLFSMWKSLHSMRDRSKMYFVTRNTFALYCGWVTAATMINLGIVLVFSLKYLTQSQYTIIFYIATPILGLLVTIYIKYTEGNQGIKSSLGLWVALIWALGGAYLTTTSHKWQFVLKSMLDL
jgi:hypothetical protein